MINEQCPNFFFIELQLVLRHPEFYIIHCMLLNKHPNQVVHVELNHIAGYHRQIHCGKLSVYQ